jgi:aldose 1-epimerase
MGFPGAVTALVTYLADGDTVRIDYVAVTSDATVVNMTNHTYFNLDGDGAGSIDDHRLAVYANRFTPVDKSGIPIAGHATVADTPFDLRTPRQLGPLLRLDHPQLADARGIDHNYVIDGDGLRPAATLTSARSRMSLEVWSDQPGLQVYTGNMLAGPGRAGHRYRVGDGIALEPQLFPDTPNRPSWPSARLAPGKTYRSTILWRFTGPVEGHGGAQS